MNRLLKTMGNSIFFLKKRNQHKRERKNNNLNKNKLLSSDIYVNVIKD